MIGEPERANKLCPTCGGRLKAGLATVPFILDNDVVVVIKKVPADICEDCHEPFMNGCVTDLVTGLLKQLQTLQSEVSVVTLPDYVPTWT